MFGKNWDKEILKLNLHIVARLRLRDDPTYEQLAASLRPLHRIAEKEEKSHENL